VRATVKPVPTITTATPVCNVAGTAFEVSYTPTFLSVITSDIGTVDMANNRITGIPSGQTVTITATLNGCTATTTATQICIVPCTTPDAGPDFTICLPKTTLDLADAPVGHVWVTSSSATINASTGEITGLTTTGVYIFTLQKEGDPTCSNEMTVTVTNGDVPNVLCNDGSTSVTLEAPANLTNVIWFSMDGTEVGTGNSLIVTSNTGGLADGTEAYYYIGEDGSASGCAVELCCPVKFITQDCCPTPNCVGVTVIKN
ncbi:MAG: hypothetical protein NWP83_00490, partial [Spirosomaceae bacterium]|nr:hypothetical protein [Spirosomataceae bacterium]